MKLPPLHSIRAFEAVARLGSVTAAGKELFVSHSAISHQLRNLEQWFGLPLVERDGRGIRLTVAGERYRIGVCEAFQRIHVETELLRRQGHDAHVKVSCLPMFTVSWLLPQMHGFWGMHPDIQVTLDYSRGSMVVDPNETDIAIRFGQPGDFPGFVAMPLLEGAAVPVASPDYLKNMAYRGVEDFDQLTLIHDESRDYWKAWLKQTRLDVNIAQKCAVLPDGNMTLASAMAGEGVALLRRAVIAAQLRSGSLEVLSDIVIDEDQNYLVLTPVNRPISRSGLLFLKWLQSLPGAIRSGVPLY